MSKNVPNVRFEGFVDKWRKASIDEIMSIRKETGNQNDYSLDVELENLVSDMGVLIGDLSIRTQSNSIFRKGDILFGRLRPYLNKWWLSNTEGVKSGEIWAFYPQGENSNVFLYSLIQTYKFLSVANTSSGTKMPRSDWSNLSNVVVYLPQFEEQQKIGSFFKQLDDTIVLQRKLVEQQQQYKKAMLQKMFPQKGERVPKVRFDGFSEDWTELKMGEVFEQTNEYINPKESNLELFSLTVEKGLTQKTARYNREFLVKKADKFKKVGPNEFVYNPMNMTLGAVGFNDSNFSVAVSGYYVTMKIKMECNNEYFRIVLTSSQAIRLYKLYATGSLIEKQRVQFPTFSEISIKVPVLEEQQKIGAFFKQLDDTIALHQKKLEDYQQLKKALLQRIFV
ncbi:restriction endonuclease subunit S [Bacillus cereus group sp. Bce019]|uniref:restriction endonuclease subunit S n=1 Tax=Bacillus cereus group sp. Bce019 TaxID=3445247 RepID=UPI003F204EDA